MKSRKERKENSSLLILLYLLILYLSLSLNLEEKFIMSNDIMDTLPKSLNERHREIAEDTGGPQLTADPKNSSSDLQRCTNSDAEEPSPYLAHSDGSCKTEPSNKPPPIYS